MEEKYCIMTFHSTHLALAFERTLKANEIPVKIIPVPRQISASCGLAGRFLKTDFEDILEATQQADIEFDGLYEYKDEKYIQRS